LKIIRAQNIFKAKWLPTVVVAIGLAVALIVFIGVMRSSPMPSNSGFSREQDAGRTAESPTRYPQVEVRFFEKTADKQPPTKRVAIIHFFDGETANIQFHRTPYRSIDYPDNLASKLGEWKEAATQGDADIARALFKNLATCRGNNFQTEAEFAAMIDKYQQTHELTTYVGDNKVSVYKEPDDDMLAMLRESYAFCKGIEDYDIQAADDWLELAANNGNVQAQLTLGQKLLAKQEGRNFLEMAWQTGNIDAASWLAKSMTMENGNISSDYIGAYAYQSLYSKLVRAGFEYQSLTETPHALAWMEADAGGLAKIGNRLAPHELQLAQELVKKLFEANENCCALR
jgi:TPR repeat protein